MSKQEPLFWWKPKRRLIDKFLFREGKLNAGDVLSKVIVNKILKNNNKKLVDNTFSNHKLLALGSVLHFSESGDTIWGTGRNGKVAESSHTFNTLDVRAVRGPKTRDYLLSKGIACPEIYGDPAILLPTLFEEFSPSQKKRDILVIPHMYEIAMLKTEHQVCTPLVEWTEFVKEIISSEFIVSSSLHGLIIAEAFGIEAVRLKISDTENDFKYEDYYCGSGRESHKIAYSVEDAIKLGSNKKPDFDTERLLNSFPLEKWI